MNPGTQIRSQVDEVVPPSYPIPFHINGDTFGEVREAGFRSPSIFNAAGEARDGNGVHNLHK